MKNNKFTFRLTLGLIALGMVMVLLSPLIAQVGSRGTPTITSAPAGTSSPERKITPAQAVVLGVVEGVTEYLPVSSTGHLILAGYAMGLTKQAGIHDKFDDQAIDAFEIVIQLGAILAVFGLYHKRVGQMWRGLWGHDSNGFKLLKLLMLAFLPAAFVGLAIHHQIKEHLFAPIPVCIAWAVGGAAMIFVERRYYRRGKVAVTPEPPLVGEDNGAPPPSGRLSDITQMSYRQALFIGIFQCLAMWPGTSRSMITMIAALLVGLDMMAAAEFSFLLALPTLTAATLYEGFKSRHELMQSVGAVELLIGLVVSGIVAAIAVKAFVRYLTRHGLVPFGIYRLILAGAVFAYLMYQSKPS
jgi:undecaprenyl-diphosphatase